MKSRRSAPLLACLWPALWPAQPAAATGLETVTVEANALPGAAVDPDKTPGSVQSLSAAELARAGSGNLTQAMEARLGSVSINDNLGDAQQPDILYRGFAASPVLGTPQGLALYQNGVRVNEAFGDTGNWDLLPEIAINQLDIVGANPVYGLNALGGAIAVSMKNGFSYQGRELQLRGGSFAQRSASAQWGLNRGRYGLYLAGSALNAQGWRRFASDSLRQAYLAFTARGERTATELGYTWDDNALAGQGSAPAAELAISRRLTFTGPQRNANRLHFLTLNSSWQASQNWLLKSVLYYRQYRQQVANGNTTDYTPCASAPNLALLCQPDGLTPLSATGGFSVPDISQGGRLLIGENDSESIAARSHGASVQATGTGKFLGRSNRITLGAALDAAHVNFLARAQLGLIDSDLLVQPSALVVDTPEGSAFAATPVSLQADNTYQGLYATDTLDLTAAWSLTASARYQVAVIDLRDRRGSALNGRNRYTHFNPQLGMTLNLSASTNLYAGIARSTRTPTASEIECSDPERPCLLPSQLAGDPPSLRQVVATTLELGLRSRTAGRKAHRQPLAWNLGLFRTLLHDDIYGVATSTSHGYFRNIAATRRQGIDCGLSAASERWSGYFNYSYLDASFQSALSLPSPSNPYRDADGIIQVARGDRLPGIPRHRIKAGVDLQADPHWSLGATLIYSSSQYYFGDEANRTAPLPGYVIVGLRSAWQLAPTFEAFATINNLLNRRYATYGIYSDPTGAGAPGIPTDAAANDEGVDHRFYTPAAPVSVHAGLRISW